MHVRRDRIARARRLVSIDPADRAEAGAVGAAEDLLGKRERYGVAGPVGDLERVVDQVRRSLFLVCGLLGLVLTRVDLQIEHRVPKTPVARPVEPRLEREPEDGEDE